MIVERVPGPALRPLVTRVWASEGDVAPPTLAAFRERVLPTGAMHLVFRLTEDPLVVYDHATSPSGRIFSTTVVGGARAGFYVREARRPARSVGAMLRPGGAELLLGAPADELADRHTALEDLWGSAASLAREQLVDGPTAEARLDRLEAMLTARTPKVPGLHPAVAYALARLGDGAGVSEVVKQSGYSHRHFVSLFRRAVGLGPKQYSRVARFQHTLGALLEREAELPELALDAGYSDQSHFNRDFRALTGLSPGQYRALCPAQTHHVHVAEPFEVNSIQDTCRATPHARSIHLEETP